MDKALKVSYARLQGIIFVPNVKQFGPELKTGALGEVKIVSMVYDDGLLMIEVSSKGKTSSIAIPSANVSHMLVE